jgi:hypothetical protein
MDIKKELQDLFDDPLLQITEKEQELFDVPADMKKKNTRETADYVAQRRLCNNFDVYHARFLQVHQEIKQGLRKIIRFEKRGNLEANHYYLVGGEVVFLESIGEKFKASKGSDNARTHCVYENGTESDILLQSLRREVVLDGFRITDVNENVDEALFATPEDVQKKDMFTGYIYVLKSLSKDPDIAGVKNLYKIGFTTNTVEERIANAENDPTYLMAPVKIIDSYKVYNWDSHKLESLIHQILEPARFLVRFEGEKNYEPKEWFVVPHNVIDSVIEKILDRSIVNYHYDAKFQALVQHQAESEFDTTGKSVLTLVIKQESFDQIVDGSETKECQKIKQSNLNRLTELDSESGKRYLRRYDLLHLVVGYHSNRDVAYVEVVNTTYDEKTQVVTYHLGQVVHVEKGDNTSDAD